MTDVTDTPPPPSEPAGGNGEGSGAGSGERRRRIRPWRRRRGGGEGDAREPRLTTEVSGTSEDTGEAAGIEAPGEPPENRADVRRSRPRGSGGDRGRQGGGGGRGGEGGRERGEGASGRGGERGPGRGGEAGRERGGESGAGRRGGERRPAASGERGERRPVQNAERTGERRPQAGGSDRGGRGRPDRRPGGRPGGGAPSHPAPAQAPREILRPVPPRGVVVPSAPALRVLIAGGGTGGHVYPALAVADEIRRRNRESSILFIGTKKGLESRIVPESGYDIEYLGISGFAGKNPIARIVALYQFGRGVLAMRAILRRFQPELVLGTGGYVSGPAVLAAHRAGIRTMIQEQNSIPGRMNRFLARFVDEIHVAYTESRSYFKQTSKIRLTGNPARIRQPRGSLLNLYRKFELDPERQTVLIVGGSRGARSINRAAVEMMPLLSARADLQFIIQTGDDDVALVQGAAAASGVKAVIRPYFTPIEEIYALGTMVVCRAGAMTLAEIAQFGLPAILVPFPFAIYQHQLMNANILAGKGAAEVILDKDLSGKVMAEKIEALLADKARRREMGLNAWNLARPDAHERLVNSIEALTHPEEKKGAVDLVDSDPMEPAGERAARSR